MDIKVGAILIILLFSSFQGHASPDSVLTTDMQLDTVYTSSNLPTVLDDSDTVKFIQHSRNIAENNGTSIDQIFQIIGTLVKLDPSLTSVTSSLKSYWVSQILDFQNSNGGFSSWKKGRSSVAATKNAIQSLSWLGALGQVNQTAVTSYLELTRNQLTNGYTSSIIDTDSDVHTTYLAVDTYAILGLTPPNSNLVMDVFANAQNLDPGFVSPSEIGGFGKQTNNQKGIYWTSEGTISRYAIVALKQFNQISLIDSTNATDFLQSLQTSSGGFTNDKLTTSVNAAYSSAAVEAITLLGATPSDVSALESYLLGLKTANGGFKKSETSTQSSLFGTYHAVKALDMVGYSFPNPQQIIDYILSSSRYVDGYGASPGAESSLRETFDAVSALTNLGEDIPNTQGIIDFVLSYQNPDGGFGLTGSFTESTYRAISIFDLLGYSYANTTLTIQFLQGLQLANGGFIKGAGKSTPYVISTYRAIMALDLLNTQPVSSVNAIAYLKSSQNTDGGFGGFIGDTSDVSSTYRAIRSLQVLQGNGFDTSAAIAYLQDSQNPDGGFKRGKLDVTAPANYSNAIFTYSSMRALHLLNSQPKNMTAAYMYLHDIHNVDGGYGYTLQYTSDIAYTFSSVWLLSHLGELSNYSLSIDTTVTKGQEITIQVGGGIPSYHLNYTLQSVNNTDLTVSSASILNQPGNLSLDTTNLATGEYSMDMTVEDLAGLTIVVTSTVEIVQNGQVIPTTDTPPLLNTTELIIIIVSALAISSLTILFVLQKLRK